MQGTTGDSLGLVGRRLRFFVGNIHGEMFNPGNKVRAIINPFEDSRIIQFKFAIRRFMLLYQKTRLGGHYFELIAYSGSNEYMRQIMIGRNLFDEDSSLLNLGIQRILLSRLVIFTRDIELACLDAINIR